MSGFMVLGGYEFARSASVSLFQTHYGSKDTPYLLLFVPFACFALLWIYGRLLTVWGPQKAFYSTTLMSALGLCILNLLIDYGVNPARALLFIFRESYIVLLIEQHWSLMDTVLNEKEAKKTNAVFLGFTSLGAIISAIIVGLYAKQWGTSTLVYVAAALLVPAAYFSYQAYEDNADAKNPPELKQKNLESFDSNLGFSYFKKFPVLFVIFSIVMIAQFLSTSLGLHFQDELNQAYPHVDDQTAFSGKFYATLNALSALFQFVLSPILLSVAKVPWILLGIPLVHFLFCSFTVFVPGLWPVASAFLVFKAIDYSLFRATKEILFIPLPFDVKYRTKGLIDVIAYRTSKGLSSVLFSSLSHAGIILSGVYAWINFIAVAIWLSLMPKLLKRLK